MGRPASYYRSAEFAARFAADTSNPWTGEGFCFPDEDKGHATFILELTESMCFGYLGTLNSRLRPLAFQVSIAVPFGRKILTQPVPANFATALRRPPLAIWRGVGTDPQHGNALAALALVSLQVNASASHLQREDPNREWVWHSYLSLHSVDVKGAPSPTKRPPMDKTTKTDQRGRPNRANPQTNKATTPTEPPPVLGPTQVHYAEIFVITVCSAPAWELSRCFDSLIPALAPFGQPSYPITIRSWHGELTNSLENFRSAIPKIGLAGTLLANQSLYVVKGAPLTTTLTDILTALATDNQDTSHIQYGFLTKGEGFPGSTTCWIAPGGGTLFHTSGLLRWTSSALTKLDDHPDMARLRERYATHRRALGLPPTATHPTGPGGAPMSTALVVPQSRVVAQGDPTFAAIARQMPQDILTAMNDHIDARVNSQVQLALRGTQTDILTLRNAQDNQGASIKRLTTAQTQLETDLQDNTKMLMEATADVLKQGETLTSILKITADLETRSKAQAATVAKLAAKLQMMGKRQATAMSDSIEDPEVAPPPTTRAAHE